MTPPTDFSLRRPRDFGEVFNDTFRFIKLALPVWWPTILRVILPLLLVASALVGGGYGTMMSGMFDMAQQAAEPGGGVSPNLVAAEIESLTFAGLLAFVGFLFYMGLTVFFSGFVYASISAYDRFGSFEDVTQEQLCKGAWARFWPLVGLYLLAMVAFVPLFLILLIPCLGILLMIGAMVYALGRLGLAASAIGVDRRGVWESVKTSHRITEGAFWQTVGVLIVSGIVANLLVSGFTFGPMFGGMIAIGLSGWEPDLNDLSWIGVALGAYYGLTICLTLLASVVSIVASGIQYAQLNEGRDLTTLWRRIDARRASTPTAAATPDAA